MSETSITTYQPKPRNAMMIKNLCPGLMEMGKIKIGNKGAVRQSSSGGTWQAPQKLDHFLITTMERGKDNNFLLDEQLHRRFGEAPKEIPVRLIYDDIALDFATRYICYYGKTVYCSGDGECAQRLKKDGSYETVSCPCHRQDPKFAGDDGKGKGKCKINGILSTIIDGADSVGGVWKFRTTSYNSVVGIMSSLALIQRITGGRLAGIPLLMTVTPKTVQDPIHGNQQTIYVVGLKYNGNMDMLRSTGYQIAMDEAKHGISMKQIEQDAILLLSHTPTAGLGDDSDQDVIEEFYPEEARPAAPALAEPAQLAPNTAAPATTGAAPALVAPQTETVDMDTGEVVETTPQPEPPKRHRRTKAEIEADRLAAEQAENRAAQQVNVSGPDQQPPPLAAAGDDDANWPDPTGSHEPPHPVEQAAEEPGTEPGSGEDLF